MSNGVKRSLLRLATLVVVIQSNNVMAQQLKWVGTWAASPVNASTKVDKNLTLGEREITIRETVHVSAGGPAIRVALTNEFGKEPLTISEAHLAFMASIGTIKSKTDHVMMFGGKPTVTIAPGEFIASDSLSLTVPSFSDVTISLCLPEQKLTQVTAHNLSVATTQIGPGNQAAVESLQDGIKLQHWYLLKDVEVKEAEPTAAVVTFGDSITDGAHSTPDANRRWPDYLAIRLAADKKAESLSVLNEGISGNRILHTGNGPDAIDRLERDVLNAPGVKYVIWLEGINDIGRTDFPQLPDDVVTTTQIIEGMRSVVQRMHAHGLKVFGATLTPFGGTKFATPTAEAMRQAVNLFIRTPGNFDAVVDFDKATQDPNHPERFLEKYDSGDHLHPSDAGYEAMSNAIDLRLLQ